MATLAWSSQTVTAAQAQGAILDDAQRFAVQQAAVHRQAVRSRCSTVEIAHKLSWPQMLASLCQQLSRWQQPWRAPADHTSSPSDLSESCLSERTPEGTCKGELSVSACRYGLHIS